ncbi:MAG: UDP-glucose 4-epimerase GalE [Granulosicoccus sp.]|nr:UDP-glucose 4-epimerase GalE [Granulosicoccus sp.]
MVRMLSQRGFEVVVYDNLERGNRDAVSSGELIVGDLHDTERLSSVFDTHDIQAVMHFAALAYVGESVHEPALYYHNNVGGTQSLLDTMRAHQVNKLVFSSTCATYGVPASLPITEDTPQNPINPYGQSKLMVEQILRDYSVAYGLRSIALRYFNAAGCAADGSLGERHDPETHLLPLILYEALRVQSGGDPAATTLMVFGDDFDTRDGTCIRDYIHVDDLCSAHIAAFERMHKTPDLGAEQFNLGVNCGYTVLEMIEACRQVTGVDFKFNSVARRAGDPPELVADASRAMSKLQWSPNHTDIEDSIRHAWQWFSAHPPAQ